MSGDQTIKGEPNQKPENISNDVSIFGIKGTLNLSRICSNLKYIDIPGYTNKIYCTNWDTSEWTYRDEYTDINTIEYGVIFDVYDNTSEHDSFYIDGEYVKWAMKVYLKIPKNIIGIVVYYKYTG